ncbi:unnamed protein product [Acanthoscelides obtectus]|uniref:Uncharacterized protein n=1 Tax=Acanthoscelides obtectus TaxID=200917 RepID=A0A9P0LLN2_ACAOB|nr:unnamed protein product [Acanthoscelides obtectus]CAK1650221.1 hypothetical protein AOBTE_LOCUS16696 [Acanthoscelides obtectus]
MVNLLYQDVIPHSIKRNNFKGLKMRIKENGDLSNYCLHKRRCSRICRPYSFMLEYGSISIIKRWLIRAKERSKKSGPPFVVIKSYIQFRL